MRKKIVLSVATLLVVAAGVAAFRMSRPSAYRVERSLVMAAFPDLILAELQDLQRWAAWSPWEIPGQVERQYGGVPGQPGHSYYWSANLRSRRGRVTLLVARPDRLELEREVISPRPASFDLEIDLAAEGAGTRVTWAVSGVQDLTARLLGKGARAQAHAVEAALARLKPIVEAHAQVERFRVRRSITVAAAPSTVVAHVMDVHNWPRWSPWEITAGGVARAYGGPPRGKGSSYYWSSEASRGRVTVLGARGDDIELELAGDRPAEFLSDVVFGIDADGAGTRVTWTMSGEGTETRTVLYPSGDAEREVGPAVERGLAALKRTLEASAGASARAAGGSR